VLVRFSAESAIYARERSWGQEQTVVELDNGEIDLGIYRGRFDEIVSWVLSFGKGARVWSRNHWFQRVMTELKEANSRY
jgi:hypothetical protein